MKQLSLININSTLYKLGKKYTEVYPKFYLSELNFIQKRAETMISQQIQGLGSQPLREAECDRMMALTPEYEEYHKLAPEMNLINKHLWIYTTISKNISSSNWSESQGL